MKRASYFALLASIPLMGAVPEAPPQFCVENICTGSPSSGSYTVRDDFEGGSLDKAWTTQVEGGANTGVSISTDVALSGTHSVKSVITRDSAGDFRAEVRHAAGKPAGVSLWNQDVWYAVSIYLPNNFVTSSGRDILVQWHSFDWLEPTPTPEQKTSPVFGIQVRNGNWEIIRRPNAGQPSLEATQESYTTDIGPYNKGQWNNWVCRIRWHWTNGQSQCWLNGQEVYNVNGGNSANDIYPPYFKFGNYRVANKADAGEPGVSPRIVYFDNARIQFSGGSLDAMLR